MGHRHFGRDSSADAHDADIRLDAKVSTRRCDAVKEPSAYGDLHIRSLVLSALLRSTCPSAVLGRVVPVGVNAVDRVLLAGSRPHVTQKQFKRIPALAHLDTAPSPSWEVLVPHIGASPLHPEPRPVLRARLASTLVTVPHHCFRALRHERRIGPQLHGPLMSKASTRANRAVPKIRSSDQLLVSAVAMASPHAWLRIFFGHNEATESLACQLNQSHMTNCTAQRARI